MGCGSSVPDKWSFAGRFAIAGDTAIQERGPGNIVVLTDGTCPASGIATATKIYNNNEMARGGLAFKFKFGIGSWKDLSLDGPPEVIPGDGFCMCLVDASHPEHMSPGDYGGGLGYDNRPGAIIGIGFDLGGQFGGEVVATDVTRPMRCDSGDDTDNEAEPSDNTGRGRLVVKAGPWRDFQILGVESHVALELPVMQAEVKFEFDDAGELDSTGDAFQKIPLLTVSLDEHNIFDKIPLPGLSFPDSMKVSFSACSPITGNRHTLLDLKDNEEIRAEPPVRKKKIHPKRAAKE